MKRFLLAIHHLLPVIFTTPAIIHQRSCLPGSLRLHKVKTFLMLLAILVSVHMYAQPGGTSQQQSEYKKVVTERVKKFTDPIGITDSATYKKIISIITNQYVKVNSIHEKTAAAVARIKANPQAKEQTDVAIKVQEEKNAASLLQQHNDFIERLQQNLPAEQIEKIKDGMTYRVFPITYTAYLDMIPSLKPEEKQKIYDWLKEARELAMDAESADKKHAVFGKYKGRINNYLSAQGYDSQKEREAWEARIKANKAAAKSSN